MNNELTNKKQDCEIESLTSELFCYEKSKTLLNKIKANKNYCLTSDDCEISFDNLNPAQAQLDSFQDIFKASLGNDPIRLYCQNSYVDNNANYSEGDIQEYTIYTKANKLSSDILRDSTEDNFFEVAANTFTTTIYLVNSSEAQQEAAVSEAKNKLNILAKNLAAMSLTCEVYNNRYEIACDDLVDIAADINAEAIALDEYGKLNNKEWTKDGLLYLTNNDYVSKIEANSYKRNLPIAILLDPIYYQKVEANSTGALISSPLLSLDKPEDLITQLIDLNTDEVSKNILENLFKAYQNVTQKLAIENAWLALECPYANNMVTIDCPYKGVEENTREGIYTSAPVTNTENDNNGYSDTTTCVDKEFNDSLLGANSIYIENNELNSNEPLMAAFYNESNIVTSLTNLFKANYSVLFNDLAENIKDYVKNYLIINQECYYGHKEYTGYCCNNDLTNGQPDEDKLRPTKACISPINDVFADPDDKAYIPDTETDAPLYYAPANPAMYVSKINTTNQSGNTYINSEVEVDNKATADENAFITKAINTEITEFLNRDAAKEAMLTSRELAYNYMNLILSSCGYYNHRMFLFCDKGPYEVDETTYGFSEQETITAEEISLFATSAEDNQIPKNYEWQLKVDAGEPLNTAVDAYNNYICTDRESKILCSVDNFKKLLKELGRDNNSDYTYTLSTDEPLIDESESPEVTSKFLNFNDPNLVIFLYRNSYGSFDDPYKCPLDELPNVFPSEKNLAEPEESLGDRRYSATGILASIKSSILTSAYTYGNINSINRGINVISDQTKADLEALEILNLQVNCLYPNPTSEEVSCKVAFGAPPKGGWAYDEPGKLINFGAFVSETPCRSLLLALSLQLAQTICLDADLVGGSGGCETASIYICGEAEAMAVCVPG